MELSKKRWLILTVCCLANLCLGSIYTWSVFASPMATYLSSISGQSLSSADLAIVYTIANSVGPITMISGGWVNDRFGPKIVILVGALCSVWAWSSPALPPVWVASFSATA